MEIVYDGTGDLTIRFDNGRKLGLQEILDLDKALTLTRTSREWNRKRVLELEDLLERGTHAEVRRYTDEEDHGPGGIWDKYQAASVRIDALEAELSRRAGIIKRLENKVEGYDTDRHTERERASELKDRLSSSEEMVAELERGRQSDHLEIVELRRQRDEAETGAAQERESYRQSLAAHNSYLEAATRRADEAEAKLMKGHVCTGGCSGDQHVAFVGRHALVELENKVAELTRKIDNARALLSDPEVTRARERVVSRLHVGMSEAIGKALDTLA